MPGQGKGAIMGLEIEIHWKKVWKGDQERVMLGNEEGWGGTRGTGKRKGTWGSYKGVKASMGGRDEERKATETLC